MLSIATVSFRIFVFLLSEEEADFLILYVERFPGGLRCELRRNWSRPLSATVRISGSIRILALSGILLVF